MAGGLAVLFDAIREANAVLDSGGDAGPIVAAYDEIVGVLGLAEPTVDLGDLAERLAELASRHGVDVAPDEGGTIDALLDRRAAARDGRDYATADALRDELAGMGIVVEDTDDGARWHRA
jgi:cysteinyl-tRNA synthetase